MRFDCVLGPKLLITEVPRNVILGSNILHQLSQVISDLHLGSNCLFIQGESESEIDIGAIATSIKSFIEHTGRKVFSYFHKSFPHSNIEPIQKLITSKNIHFLVVLGESFTIEDVKYVIQLSDKEIDWISIPTAPVHDGFCSPFVFLLEEDGAEEYYGLTKPPIAVFADTEIIQQTTSRAIKSGIGVLLSKFSSNWDWKLASRLRSEPISDFTALVSDELMFLQANNLKYTSVSPNNPQISITEILKGLIISGFLGSFSNNIRASYGSEHMFAQALDHVIPGQTLRGERVALGTIMMSSLQGQDWRVIRDYYKSAGVAVTADELGIKSSTIVKALLQAVQYPKKLAGKDRFYTILGEDGLTEDAAFRLMYRTGIIGKRPGLN